ncbi:MAG: type III pantothenate kinase [Bacteroidales bacterium]|nr:type III pantothenate kinase [Bacteroidales bacterium]
MIKSEGFLAVDCGNTRLKATFLPDDPTSRAGSDAESDPEGGAEVRFFPGDRSDLLMEWVEQLKERVSLRGALAVVGKVDVRLAETLRQALDDNFLAMTPATELPIGLAYRTPLTLGLDRKATACAAVWRFPGQGALVVDAGTALTLDLIDADGVFVGGNISPGLRLRFRSLNAFTAKLPLIEEVGEDIPDFGFHTHSAIRAGVVGGWADEVEGNIRRAMLTGVGRVLLTGGDAALLLGMLCSRFENELDSGNLKIEHYPHLLAEGLRAIYRHHEN